MAGQYGFHGQRTGRWKSHDRQRSLFEVLPAFTCELKGIQNSLRDALCWRHRQKLFFVGVDYLDFNLGLEEQPLRAGGIPTMHFIGRRKSGPGAALAHQENHPQRRYRTCW